MSIPASSTKRAFTLTEILVVVGVIALLAAILFPVMSRARQSSYQTRCSSNLQQIYIAVRQYKQDENAYPNSIGAMLPAGSQLIVASGAQTNWADPADRGEPVPDKNIVGGNGALTNGGATAPIGDEDSEQTVISTGGTGVLKSTDLLLCPSDTVETVGLGSSYEMKRVAVWNHLGYDSGGHALSSSDAANLNPQLRFTPGKPFDAASNPIVNSLSNRFAPSSTIVTHCIYHRGATSGLSEPERLYQSNDGAGARDVILRLDGSTKAVDVSRWSEVEAGAKGSRWQKTD